MGDAANTANMAMSAILHPLTDSVERNSAIAWPLPVDRRLDELVATARDFGEQTNRKELAAAILFGVEAEGDHLGRLLKAYRKARARDAVLTQPDSDNVLHLPRHRPGPRAHSS